MDVVYKMSEGGASLFDAAAVIAFLTIVLKRNDRIKNITEYRMIMLAFVAGLGFLQDISENAGITLLCIFTGSFVFSLFFLQGSWKSKFLYNLIFYVTGRGVMTVCLFCYLGARSLANRILLDIL